MPRTHRIDYPGALHHIMNRGARRAPLFSDERSKSNFLQRLSALPEQFGVELLAYAIMPNHYHLVVKSVHGNVGYAMKWLGQTVTQDINQQPRWDGPVFRGRYRNRVVQTRDYYQHLLAYVHLNPVPSLARHPVHYRWSSARMLHGLMPVPEWLSTSAVDACFGTRAALIAYTNGVLQGRLEAPALFQDAVLWEGPASGLAERTTGEHIVACLHQLTVEGHGFVQDQSLQVAARVLVGGESRASIGRKTGLSRHQVFRCVKKHKDQLAIGSPLRMALDDRLLRHRAPKETASEPQVQSRLDTFPDPSTLQRKSFAHATG